MRLIRLCCAAGLALTGSAQAQDLDLRSSSDCASFERNSLEWALFDCDQQNVPAEGAALPPTESLGDHSADAGAEAPSATEFEPVEVAAPNGLPPPDEALATAVADAEDQATREWLERHRIGEPLEREAVEVLDPVEREDLPPPSPGARYAEIDGMVVELDPESYELLQLIRRSAGLADGSNQVTARELEDLVGRVRPEENDDQGERAREARAERGDELEIPNGHLPPPGSCRVWYPDRPAGHQPPPTSCNVEVPDGAVLIHG